MKNLRAASAAFVVVALGPGWVLAEPAQLRFDWRAPDTCPSRERVLARAEELLGRAPESALSAELELRALLVRDSAGLWQLELRSRNESGQTTRNVTAASCAELADAAALLLALAIDPTLSERTSPPSSAFLPEEQPAAVTAQVAPPPASAKPGPSPAQSLAREPSAAGRSPSATAEPEQAAPPLRFRAGGAFAVWSRRLPGAAPGVVAHAGISRARGFADVAFGVFPARHASVAGSPAGGDLSLFSFGAELGYTIAVVTKRFEAAPVLGAELDWVQGTGTGVSHPADGNLLLVGVSGGARAALHLSSSWVLFGQGLVSGLVARPRFVLEGVGEVYRPPGWGLRFSLGAEWRQP